MAGTVVNNRDPLEERPGADSSVSGMMLGEQTGYGVIPGEDEEEAAAGAFIPPLTDENVLAHLKECEPRASEFFEQKAMPRIQATYRAARNEHPSGSKYLTANYKNRSRYHRPKTRASIEKCQTAAANALFATRDVVSVNPSDESNAAHKANAALQKELLNYRLSRSSGRNAIPWYLTALGARTDAFLNTYCISKQSWLLRRRRLEPTVVPVTDEMGNPALDEIGQPMLREEEQFEVLEDRPDVKLYPIENVGIDPAAPWFNPAAGAFLSLREAMYRNDVLAMMDDVNDPDIPWRRGEITDADFKAASILPGDRGGATTRQAREDEHDRFDDQGRSTAAAGDGNVLCWVYEWFFNWGGEDYCVWTLGTRTLLSDPIAVAEAYPAFGGKRPVVVGLDVIWPHDIYPLSNAQALQPIQQEINDQVNLRMDAQKQAVSPVTKVKRGRNVDPQQVVRRGPSTMIMVQDADDVTFEPLPTGAAALFAEMDRLNVDFDELAGQFSNSSVQSNRSLNETVGGMQILAGDAQATSSMKLRTWTETWAEPVVAQLIKLEQYYESDATILGLCGERAKLFTKFGVSHIDDALLMSEVTTTVDIGVGASDPNAAMARFKMAWDTAAPVIAGDMASGRVKTRPVEIVNEVFGNAQFKDAGARFFEINEQAVDPQVQQLQQQLQQVTAELEKAKAGNETKLQVAQINAEAKLTESREDHDHEEKMAVVEHQMDMQELLVHGLQAAAGDARRGEMDQQRDERQIRGKQDLANAGHRAGMMKTALPMMMPKPDGAAPAAPGPLPDAGAPPQPAAAPPPQQGGMEQVLAMMATMLAQTQQGLKQNAQLLARMAESTENNNQALAAAMQDIARAMSAPKRLVRDENGRAIGVAAGGA